MATYGIALCGSPATHVKLITVDYNTKGSSRIAVVSPEFNRIKTIQVSLNVVGDGERVKIFDENADITFIYFLKTATYATRLWMNPRNQQKVRLNVPVCLFQFTLFPLSLCT